METNNYLQFVRSKTTNNRRLPLVFTSSNLVDLPYFEKIIDMPSSKEIANDIQECTLELRKLRTEERMLEKLLKEANGQLTQLKVEALEIKNRTRQVRQQPAEHIPTSQTIHYQ